MMGHTHFTIGAAAGLAVALAASADIHQAVGLGLLGGLAALLPDIDHPQSIVRKPLGIAGRVGLFWLSHRGITHTLAAWLLVSLLFRNIAPGWPGVALSWGYFTHLWADAITRRGIPLFWPLSDQPVFAMPRWFRIATGGVMETMIWLVVLAAMIYLLVRINYA